MKTDEIRRRFLEFFRERDHRVLPPDSLVPAHDPSLLFTSYEQGINGTIGGLPRAAVAALNQELSELADPSFRQHHI